MRAQGATASLRPFRDPASVAVVGASDDPGKWGYWLSGGALQGADRRTVHLVNEHAGTVHGRRCVPRLSALPETPELVVVCVPPSRVRQVVADGLALGARAFLVITSGVPDEPDLVREVTARGARIVGPNSLGIAEPHADLWLAWGTFAPGSLAVISQSGQLGTEIAALAARTGMGISRFVSIGNQRDVRAAELLSELVEDERTQVVALYLESFAGGEDLVDVMRALRCAGKYVLVLTTGASWGSKRLARSHTGSITSSVDVVDAACRAAGALRVPTPTTLVEVARYLQAAPLPGGRRLAIVSDSGGQGGIAADLANANGLSVPVLGAETRERIATELPSSASAENPVDLAGAGDRRLGVYAELSRRLQRSGDVDAVVLSGYFGCYGENSVSTLEEELRVVDRLGDQVDETAVPVVVHTMSATSQAYARLWQRGVPAYTSIEAAIAVCAAGGALATEAGRDLAGPDPVAPGPGSQPAPPGYLAARELLDAAGIPFPRALPVRRYADVDAVARRLGGPVVLKAGWLDHKTEAGGLTVGLEGPTALRRAFAEMHGRLGDGDYVVEEQDRRPYTVEMLVGGRHDRDFGALVVVGVGGTETELHRDVALELAPVDLPTAHRMIDRLRCRSALDAWRGRPAVDVDALAAVVVAVGRLISGRATLAEVELNPVRVAPDGAVAVDALVVEADPDGRANPDLTHTDDLKG